MVADRTIVVARVPQRLQLLSVIAAVVGGCGGGGGGVLCSLAKDIARVDMCRCVCMVLRSTRNESFFEKRNMPLFPTRKMRLGNLKLFTTEISISVKFLFVS